MKQKSEDNWQITAIERLFTVDSTNNYALQRIREDLAQHGTTFFADEQTAGKGQRGKKWLAKSGENIQMSIVVDAVPLSLNNRFGLSAAVALATRQFVEDLTHSDIFIKWPNDIYFQDRKAGGILIENIIAGNKWAWAVIGIGLNMNQTSFNPELPNPVSLKQITGKFFDCFALAETLRKNVLQNYTLLINEPPEKIIETYNRYLYKKGSLVKFKKDTRVFEARVKQVEPNGYLTVEHSFEESFDFGEVVWITDGY